MADRTKTNDSATAKTTRKLALAKDPVASVRAEAPKPLSLKEKNVLEFLESYIGERGISPTYQEICNHFGFASFNSVQRYLKQLEVKGYVQLPWANQKRAITILKPSSSLRETVSLSANDDDRPSNNMSSGTSSMMPAIMPSESLSLPLLGRVAAGAPIEAVEHDEFIDVPASLVRHADRTYALRVQGQSMIDDGILDGDVILVQRQNTAQNGEITVAMIGEEATVKRFYSHRNAKDAPAEALNELLGRLGVEDEAQPAFDKLIELRPANSTMSPMWFHPSEVQIRGIVVGLIRRFV